MIELFNDEIVLFNFVNLNFVYNKSNCLIDIFYCLKNYLIFIINVTLVCLIVRWDDDDVNQKTKQSIRSMIKVIQLNDTTEFVDFHNQKF